MSQFTTKVTLALDGAPLAFVQGKALAGELSEYLTGLVLKDVGFMAETGMFNSLVAVDDRVTLLIQQLQAQGITIDLPVVVEQTEDTTEVVVIAEEAVVDTGVRKLTPEALEALADLDI